MLYILCSIATQVMLAYLLSNNYIIVITTGNNAVFRNGKQSLTWEGKCSGSLENPAEGHTGYPLSKLEMFSQRQLFLKNEVTTLPFILLQLTPYINSSVIACWGLNVSGVALSMKYHLAHPNPVWRRLALYTFFITCYFFMSRCLKNRKAFKHSNLK